MDSRCESSTVRVLQHRLPGGRSEAEKRIAAKLAKTMAMLCVRNTHLETIHAGDTPVTKKCGRNTWVTTIAGSLD